MRPRVSVIGLGHLGAPMMAIFAAAGLKCYGYDQDKGKVRAVAEGRAPVYEPGLQELMEKARPHLLPTHMVGEAVAESDITFIVVPTPSRPDGSFSLDQVLNACSRVRMWIGHKDEPHTLVITSTVNPGDMALLARELRADGVEVGTDLHLLYNPEFIALGTVIHDFVNPPYVLIGTEGAAGIAVLEDVYTQVFSWGANEVRSKLKVMSWANAEVAKLAQNVYLDVKIAFANEITRFCEHLPGGNAYEVLDAIGTDPRIGGKFLKPGPPYGGPCLPRDARALMVAAEGKGGSGFARLVDLSNQVWEITLIERIITLAIAFGSRRTVGVLGLSYKPGTTVAEESFGIKLTHELYQVGLTVNVYDPLLNAQEIINATAGTDLAIKGKYFVENALDEFIRDSDVLVLALPILHEVKIAPLRDKLIFDLWGQLRYLGLEGPNYICLGVNREESEGATDGRVDYEPACEDE